MEIVEEGEEKDEDSSIIGGSFARESDRLKADRLKWRILDQAHTKHVVVVIVVVFILNLQ